MGLATVGFKSRWISMWLLPWEKLPALGAAPSAIAGMLGA